MDIIEHNEYIEHLIKESENKNMVEKHEREFKSYMDGINKMHALMSEMLTPLAANYWRTNRIKEYGL